LAPRASDSRFLFEDDGERRRFLTELGRIFELFEIALVAYTLMGTHYHVVVKIPDSRVSRAIQELHTWHSRAVNMAREREAHLFRAHPFAREITSDQDLLMVCRYVARNPVEAGLASDPFAWRWGSARATAGLAQSPVTLDLEPLRSAFGSGLNWRQHYREFIQAD
jgi:REP element-mobilizing transposase RayT